MCGQAVNTPTGVLAIRVNRTKKFRHTVIIDPLLRVPSSNTRSPLLSFRPTVAEATTHRVRGGSQQSLSFLWPATVFVLKVTGYDADKRGPFRVHTGDSRRRLLRTHRRENLKSYLGDSRYKRGLLSCGLPHTLKKRKTANV
jgi:hypothetical protein